MNAEFERLTEARAALGSDLLVLAHHYQRDEIVAQADYVGDSLELAQRAAGSVSKHIVFCGVTFMAETAAVLASPGQSVYLPRRDAGCYLADQATFADVRMAWGALGQVFDVEQEVTPVAYVNTSAEVKEFVGNHGGSCCTSSSVAKVFREALKERRRILFVPDQHLGRNAARALGIADNEIAVWDPRLPPCKLEPYTHARLILWQGACNVHVRFLPEDVDRTRREHPNARIIVHPECRPDVAERADELASTSQMVRRVQEATPGTVFAIGTEQRLVHRLAQSNPDKTVISLATPQPFCSTMSLTKLSDVERIVTALANGDELEPVFIRFKTAGPARRAVQRLLTMA